MRPFDYDPNDAAKRDGLYARCMCGLPWTAHSASIPAAQNGCRRYQPMIGTYRLIADEQPDMSGRKRYIAVKSTDKYDAKFIAECDFKTEHIHTIARRVLNRIAAHGARDFPRECCGFILGDKVEDVRPIKNTNRYGNGSYTMDPMQQIAVLREVENGKELKVVYHSHPNMGAFFSGIDRDAASSIDPKKPDWPDTVWIVMSIRNRNVGGIIFDTGWAKGKGRIHLADARAYLWNPAITDFSEITLKVVE